METLVFILALSNVVCGIALLIATRTIYTLEAGDKDGRKHKNNSK